MQIIAIAEKTRLKKNEEKINKVLKCLSKKYSGIEHIIP